LQKKLNNAVAIRHLNFRLMFIIILFIFSAIRTQSDEGSALLIDAPP